MLAFFISFLFYLISTLGMLKYYTARTQWPRQKAIDKTFDIINFINAIVATVLSTVALYQIGAARYNVNGKKTIQLEDWAIESVCAYICMEFLLVFSSSYLLSRSDWELMKSRYMGMEIFHAVALLGLGSVFLFNHGYPLAMWVIWTELTSVFLGIDDVMIGRSCSYRGIKRIISSVTLCLFFFQRVVIFAYLVWLSALDLKWEIPYFAQFCLLFSGLVLNVKLAISQMNNS